MRHTPLLSGGLVLAALLVLGISSPASAHDSLVSSSPAAGERRATAPTEVELVFSDEVLPVGAAVLVVDAAGTDWVSGDLAIDRNTVTVPLSSGMPEAGYQVRWRVVSGDGHPISAIIPFAIGDAEPLTATAPEPADPTSSADADAAPSEAPSEASQMWTTVAIGAAGAVAAVGIYAAVLTIHRRRAVRAGGTTRHTDSQEHS